MLARGPRDSAWLFIILCSEMCYLHRYKWLYFVNADDSETMLKCGTYSSEEFTKD